MNNFICAALLTAAIVPPTTANAQVSVNVGVPGLYGRVDIGGYASPPPLLYNQPTYVDRGPRDAPPLYLHVPPGHERHWRQHCAEYDACGRPVYFVQHDWYRDVYARRQDGRRDGDRRDDRRDGGRDDRGDDRRNEQGPRARNEGGRDNGDAGRERGDDGRQR